MARTSHREGEMILVTGQSGVAVKRCCKTVARVEPISVEDEIPAICGTSFDTFLVQPECVQFETWRKAFSAVLSRAKHDGMVTFHATYYHQAKRELFSPVDLDLVRSLDGQVKMVMVFIDDIYDVYRRLMAAGEMYEHVVRDRSGQGPLAAIYASIFNIISLLNWREMEISFSRAIANLLHTKLLVVSTKHPAFMVGRLVRSRLEDLKIYYLSHPITAVREEATEYLPPFVGELQRLIEKILSAKDCILFFPTTIDELIIKREKQSNKEYYYYPELAQRWAHPYSDVLLSPALPSALSQINPLNPLGFQLPADKSDAVNKGISCLLSLLWEYIHLKQTISRDYTLVEQSRNGVIACRPFFGGTFSGGVSGELAHNFRLMAEESGRQAIVFSTKEDRNRHAIKKLFDRLSNSLESPLPKLADVRAQWERERVNVWDSPAAEVQKKLHNDLLYCDYDFKVMEQSNPWSADHFGQKVSRRARTLDSIIAEAKLDDINALCEGRSAEAHRLLYQTWPQDEWWGKLDRWLDKNLISGTRR